MHQRLEKRTAKKLIFVIMESYSTLVEAINGLKAKGYTEDFNLKENCIDCRNGKYQLSPDDFKVDHVFRFEGESDQEDQAVLYAISSEKHNIKGVLVNAYGVYSDTQANELIKKLKVHEEK
jgi:hypothetical protein